MILSKEKQLACDKLMEENALLRRDSLTLEIQNSVLRRALRKLLNYRIPRRNNLKRRGSLNPGRIEIEPKHIDAEILSFLWNIGIEVKLIKTDG